MKFDYIIGNPPYQEETESTSDNPVYNLFMDAAYNISNKVELITPGRFLFGAGKTPDGWSERMLGDEHFKVLFYEPDSTKVFPNVSIEGGVAIHYRSAEENFGSIGVFYACQELKSINELVYGKEIEEHGTFTSLNSIMYSSESYKFTEKMHKENASVINNLSKGHRYDITTNIFGKAPEIFYSDDPKDEHKYIRILGLEGKNRTFKYIRKDYVNTVDNLEFYKVFLPKSHGSKTIGQAICDPTLKVPIIGTPVLGLPLVGATQTFLSIGSFTEEEAYACFKYIKTKFVRILLGILKVTQHNPPEKWKYVPKQDFTGNSDIDWTKSISEIDKQLYEKYGLDEKEIDFIEKNVEEME